MEIGAYRKREHCFPSSFFVQADLDSFVFSAFGVVPLSLQAYISFHHSLVGLELSLMGTTNSFIKEHTDYFSVTVLSTGKLQSFTTSDDVFGPDVGVLHCFISFEVYSGMYFYHLFLLQALSCGLTSFHFPWAVPSPMTTVWAGLLTCAINTFLPSGWY